MDVFVHIKEEWQNYVMNKYLWGQTAVDHIPDPCLYNWTASGEEEEDTAAEVAKEDDYDDGEDEILSSPVNSSSGASS